MEQILNDYDNFIEFVQGHEQVLEKEDFNYMFNETKNNEIKKYLMESGNIEVNDNEYITTLTDPKFKTTLINKIEEGISINTEKDDKTLLDFLVIKYINKLLEDEFKDEIEYFNYILFIIEKGGTPNLQVIRDNLNNIVNMNSNHLQKVLMLIDLFIIKGAKKIEINKTNEIELLLFKNLDKNVEMSDELRKRLKIDKEEEKKEVKINNFVVYEDDVGTSWIFNRNLFEKIKKNHRNPYTNDIINQDEIDELEKKFN
tara:strand:- start:184 stop:954 length:771 start_codon:yes stop_codon:yes gene_type:complete